MSKMVQRRAGERRKKPAVRDQATALLTIVAAVWLFVSALVLGYTFTAAANNAHLNDIGVGICVFLAALARLLRPIRRWPSAALILLLGAWLVAAPFVVDYGDTSRADAARANDVAVGAVIMALGAMSLLWSSLALRPESRGE